jgi:hypothetical protein
MNSSSFSLANFTNVLAGGGTLMGVCAVIFGALAVAYALCFRRARISLTRTGLSIEPSPQRADSADSPVLHSQSRPAVQVAEVQPPIASVPKRAPRKSKSPSALSAEPSQAGADTASTGH